MLVSGFSAIFNDNLQIQTLRNFHDFLVRVEDDMKAGDGTQKADSSVIALQEVGCACF
jgi:hypothetical protein